MKRQQNNKKNEENKTQIDKKNFKKDSWTKRQQKNAENKENNSQIDKRNIVKES